ncbi:hypothetical protein [Streptomyces sp. NPDC059466]|uniref:hypothetical protein n=1 Tax=unclassified Streptomyces TaxID=2593676 RepID=UPI003684159D
MVSLIEELETREVATRVRVKELESEIAELTSRLAGEREVWSRLRVTRETMAQVLTEPSGQDVAETAPLREPVAAQAPVEPEVRVVDSGISHFVVSGVDLHDADYLMQDEVVLKADFASEWYVRPVGPGSAG